MPRPNRNNQLKNRAKPVRRRPIPRKSEKQWFFGWNNAKWFMREISKMYSTQSSYFSKKRLESGISFIIGQVGMICFLIFKYQDLTMADFIWWASLEFAVGGYITWEIQKQKKLYRDPGYYEDDNWYNNESEEPYHDRRFRGTYYSDDSDTFGPEPTGPPANYRRTDEPV